MKHSQFLVRSLHMYITGKFYRDEDDDEDNDAVIYEC